MIERESRVQKPVWPSARFCSRLFGITRKRLILRPRMESSAGRKVAEAAIETSGTSRPPTPIERMKGSGMKTSSANPIATVPPENRVARPAVRMVMISASCADAWVSSSSRNL